MSKEKIVDPINNRKYLRTNVRIPVEFTIVRLTDELLGIDWEQGETCNVSEGGFCLETCKLGESTIQYLKKEVAQLDIRVELPGSDQKIKVFGKIMWHKELESEGCFMLGIHFLSIVKPDLKQIIKFARRNK